MIPEHISLDLKKLESVFSEGGFRDIDEKCKCGGSGWLINENRQAYPCECKMENFKRDELERLKKAATGKISDYINKTFTIQLKPDQKQPWNKLNESTWLYGKHGFGKTYMITHKMAGLIKTAQKFVRWKWYEGSHLKKLFLDKYDTDLKVKRRAELEYSEISEYDMIFINDIETVKNTDAFNENLFNLIDHLLSKVKRVYITSNMSIDEYCKDRIFDLNMRMKISSRLKRDICQECFVGKEQLEI